MVDTIEELRHEIHNLQVNQAKPKQAKPVIQKPWNVRHAEEWGIYQENVQNLNASYVTKRGI